MKKVRPLIMICMTDTSRVFMCGRDATAGCEEDVLLAWVSSSLFVRFASLRSYSVVMIVEDTSNDHTPFWALYPVDDMLQYLNSSPKWSSC